MEAEKKQQSECFDQKRMVGQVKPDCAAPESI
jgi:hypothetical protein